MTYNDILIKNDYTPEISHACLSDCVDIQAITHEAFIQYIKEAQIPTTLDAVTETIEDIFMDIQNKTILIAKINSQTVGSLRILVHPDKTAYISRFGVLCQFHNSGVGRALMSNAIDYLVKGNIKSVSLHTAANNTKLVNFYTQFGFKSIEISHEKGYARAFLTKYF